ncbi:MAG: GFA family protein [Luminiphilus sp.]|nr:GFA family protein [Luminiphilus sp.]
MTQSSSELALITHEGGCHCGKIQWEIEAPAHLQTHTCNCSICALSHYQHLIVPKHRFHLLSGEAELGEYRFGSGLAAHYFCNTCGIKSFYIPRSNPDGVSVHARCLNPATVLSITDTPFDGQNWEKNAASLAHLSKA